MNIFKTIAEDVNNVKRLDPAAQSKFIIWLTYPGLHARWSHVVEHWLWNHGLKSLARISSQFTRFMTGVEIHPAAKIGRRFFIDHAMGVIIGMVGVNAAVLGSITIHDNSKVGGGAVVVEDVPENCTVVGVPARVVVRNGKLVQQEEKNAAARRECLPDPTTADVVELQARVARLETLLAAQAQGKTIGGPAKTTPDVASDSE